MQTRFGLGFGFAAGAYGRVDRQKPAIDYLMLVGSSTTDQAFKSHPQYGDMQQAGRAAMTAMGIDVPIICKAVSGSFIANLDSNINTYLTSVSGLSNVGVLINIGSNDIGGTSYAAMAPATRDAMSAGLDSIISKVLAAGRIPILATVHSRYGLQSVYDSWAVNLYTPKAIAQTPDWVSGGACVFDYNALYALHQGDADVLSTSGANIISSPDGVSDWWQTDTIHPLLGAAGYRDYTAQQFAAFATCPALPEKEKVIVLTRGNTIADSGGFSQILGAATSLTSIYNSKGELKSGATFTKAAAYGSSSGKTVALNSSVSINNSQIQSECLFSSGSSMSVTLNMGASYANRTGTLRATGASGSSPRITRITVSSGGAGATYNAQAAGAQIATVPFTMNGSGSLTITAAPESPSTTANLSGLEFEFDPA